MLGHVGADAIDILEETHVTQLVELVMTDVLGLLSKEYDATPEDIKALVEARTAALTELAEDLYQGCPMVKGNRLFDGDWDRKYLHGGR